MASDVSAAKQPKRPISSLPIFIVGAVVILGGALFYYSQYASPRAVPDAPLTAEATAYIGNLKLSDVAMKATKSYFNQLVVEINGKIGNAGDRGVELIEIYCVFYDPRGQIVLRKRVPIVGARMGGLKPGETKSFRLPFDEIPESWNQTMPRLVIAQVKFS